MYAILQIRISLRVRFKITNVHGGFSTMHYGSSIIDEYTGITISLIK